MTGAELIAAYQAGRRDFYGANLARANLSGAYLRGANLNKANLGGANLSEVYLYRANLRGANLYDANLRGANLGGANLSGADLRGADLRGAKIDQATQWPAPTMILLASWGAVSYDLCVRLMAYDASNHPKPTLFDRWSARPTRCPYNDQRLQRVANFVEKAALWPGWDKAQHMVLPAIKLAEMVISEKCEVVA